MKKKHTLVRQAVLLTATGLLLAGGVETALAEADKYRLVWNDDPATAMTIGWCQNNTATHYLRYGTSPDSSAWTRTDVGTITNYTNPEHGSGEILIS